MMGSRAYFEIYTVRNVQIWRFSKGFKKLPSWALYIYELNCVTWLSLLMRFQREETSTDYFVCPSQYVVYNTVSLLSLYRSLEHLFSL